MLGWLIPFLHFGRPRNRLHMVTTDGARRIGQGHRVIQKLRVTGWMGISSRPRAQWFFGVIFLKGEER